MISRTPEAEMRYETTVAIDADVEEVWRVLSAVGNWPDWTPTVLAARKCDDGPLRVGGRVELRQPAQPSRVWTVTELVPSRSFTWTSTAPGLRLTAGHRLRADGSGTLAGFDFTVEGALSPLARVAARTVRRFVDTEAHSLKSHCERQARPR
ncbi:SRPBCC family protein [Saccharomonospora xinjiangensis]|uniref:SRPBCC family protein n=1 Tax=Saccharomonospora xinjiangensis TaxID=75294 RepID=UPI001FFC36EC|nr:SRPBCC family protein [Saccharomonospora xinjiangensis]